MKFIIIFALINLVFFSQAQTSFKDEVLLFPLNDNTIITIDGERKVLEKEFLCNRTARIKILSGQISVMTTGGEEIPISAGRSFNVKNARSSKKSVPLGRISKYLDAPSTYLPNLYSDNRSEFKVFPLESKILDKSNLIFYFSEELSEDAVFKIFLRNTDSPVWETKNLSDKLNGKNISLMKGKKYCWKIYNGSNSLKGNLELVDSKKHDYLKLNARSSKLDYLNTFFSLLEEEYRFDAIAVLLKARKTFPDSKLFKSLLSKFSQVID